MSETMPSEYWQGVEQFNSGQFYACHDTLEALWIEATEPEKTFYQGILQIAVALYHMGNLNWRGAAILLGEGSNRLRRYPSSFGGIDVDELLSQSAVLLKAIQAIAANPSDNDNLSENFALPIPKIILNDE